MYDSRKQRQQVENWINAQSECPTRKQVKRQFPQVGQKHIRAALQSRQDRERREGA